MAEMVLKNARVKLGTSGSPTTTLSPFLRSVTVNYSAEILDKTAMGSNSRRRIAGLKDWTATLEFNQSFNTSNINKFFFNLVGKVGSSNCYISIRPESSGVGSTHRYYGKGLLDGYTPISGGVGDLATFSVNILCDGNLTRSSNTQPA